MSGYRYFLSSRSEAKKTLTSDKQEAIAEMQLLRHEYPSLGSGVFFMIRLSASCVLAMGLLSACATPPEKIAGVPSNAPCSGADRERLAILYNKQQQAVSNDAMGVFLVGLPLASMGGADNEAEIAILKGRCGNPGA